MRCAIYVRVSTEEQAKEGYSLNAQIEKLEAFAYSQSWTITKRYIEEGKSAKDIDRPELKKLLAELDQFDVVLVYKLDRLSRSVGDINYLLKTFDESKVSFKSATEPYDTTTSQGKLLINIFASLAQFEREQLAERVKMGMRRKHDEGLRNGSTAPFGYDLVNGKLVINENEAKWVKYIFETYLTKGATHIAKHLTNKGVLTKQGVYWRDTSIRYALSNPVYYGYLRWNYRELSGKRTYEESIVPGEHDAIIDKSLFNEVQKVRQERQQKGTKTTTSYMFSGVLRCARCGDLMFGGKNVLKNSVSRFYRCHTRSKFNKCDMPNVPENVLEEHFLKMLDAPVIDLPDVVEEIDVNDIEKEIVKLSKRLNRIEDLYLDGEMTKENYRVKKNEVIKKQMELQDQLETIEVQTDPQHVQLILSQLKEHWFKYSFEERKQFIQDIVESINVEVVKPGNGGRTSRPEIEIIDFITK